MSYTLKMMAKKGILIDGYYDYRVYPLEGFWSLPEQGIQKGKFDKEDLVYKIMIKQPPFINEHLYKLAREECLKKVKTPLLKEVTFEEIQDGLSVCALHIGSYDDEPITFAMMKTSIEENNLQI